MKISYKDGGSGQTKSDKIERYSKMYMLTSHTFLRGTLHVFTVPLNRLAYGTRIIITHCTD